MLADGATEIVRGRDSRFARYPQAWTLRDGRDLRMEVYATPEEGLAAVGC